MGTNGRAQWETNQATLWERATSELGWERRGSLVVLLLAERAR